MVDAIGGMNIGSVVSTAGNRASVTRDQFLQILVTELTTQNPMDPLDNGEFMQQLVGLQSLEQTAALTDSLKSFERFIQMSTASNLIGQTIKGLTGGRVLRTAFLADVWPPRRLAPQQSDE